MEKIKINICSLGDPASPKTWSGTTFNIYTELLRTDRLSSAFNSICRFNKLQQKIINLFSNFYYSRSVDQNRGFLYRYLYANKILKATKKSQSAHTLHTGTLDLPFIKKTNNQYHYLYCDSTWNLWSTCSTDMQGYSPKMLADAEILERKAYAQMEHFFPISEYVKENLISHYGIRPEKITVAGTGLGIIKPYFGEKTYTNGKILFAAKGRFKDKGGFLVLEAFKLALEKNPNLELTIVGQNEYSDQIALPNVTTHGFIPLEELQNLFNEHSLFLMPAINEPWGLVYLEAMACKMPIVGINKNSFPELSGNGTYGFGLNDADPNQLAQIILQAFANPEHMKDMGLKAQDFCMKNFSWENTVSTITQKIDVIHNTNKQSSY